MAKTIGKVKGLFADSRDSLLGAAVISGVIGIVSGILVFLIGGIGWALGFGIAVFLLLGGLIAYVLLSDSHGPPTEGEVDEQGYRHGRWVWKGDHDKLLRERNYVHGVKDGPQISWHENGNKHEEICYRNGKFHGKWTIWYENGNKQDEDTYADGHMKGQHGEWYQSGQQKKECCFHDDEVPDGDWNSWYENGKKWIAAHFECGTPAGVWTEWNSKGDVLCQREFRSGIQQGSGRRYFSDFADPRTVRGNILFLLLAVLFLTLATYQQLQPFPIFFDLFVIVFIHELGHFAVARLVGIPISHFVLGVGPRLFGFHLGNTAFEVRLLPFMGYVRAYELRRSEYDQFCANNAKAAIPSNVDLSEPRSSTIEFVTRPRQLVFFVGGVAFNFATALVVAALGWTHEHPDASFLEAAHGTFHAIWALTPFIGNSQDYMSGFRIMMGTGFTLGTIGLISLVVAGINLLPIPPLDGFHVVRVLIAMVMRREVPDRYLLPFKIAGACLIIVAFTLELVFITGGFVSTIRLGVQQWHTPPIVGQPENLQLFDGPVRISLNQQVREVPTVNDIRLLALTLNVEGSKTLLMEEYVVVGMGTGSKYRPSGIFFGKAEFSSVFTDRREAERVELSQATGTRIVHAVQIDPFSDTDQVVARSLTAPYLTLLYEVSYEKDQFELRYDDAVYALKFKDSDLNDR